MDSEAESGGDAFRGEATFDSVNERSGLLISLY